MQKSYLEEHGSDSAHFLLLLDEDLEVLVDNCYGQQDTGSWKIQFLNYWFSKNEGKKIYKILYFEIYEIPYPIRWLPWSPQSPTGRRCRVLEIRILNIFKNSNKKTY